MAYYSQIHKIHRQGKNPESCKGKTNVLNQDGKTCQVHSRSVHRTLAGQKSMAGY